MYKKLNKKGFTLIELIVVIAVIGILVLVAAPRFLGYTRDAHVAAMKADIKVLSNAALIYFIDGETKDEADALEWPVLFSNGDGDTITIIVDSPDHDDPVEITGYLIDPDLLGSDYIKNLKNDFDDYMIVIDEDDIVEGSGVSVGDVYHIEGVKDKSNTGWFGIKLRGELADSGDVPIY